MAQPRPSRAHVVGRTVAVALLAAAPAGTLGIPPFDHITPAAGGLSVLLRCPVACVAAAVLRSVPARWPGADGPLSDPAPYRQGLLLGRFIQAFALRSQRIGGVRRDSWAHMPAVAPAPSASRWFWLQTIAFGDSRLHHRHRYATDVA